MRGRRGYIVSHALVVADVLGILLAFYISTLSVPSESTVTRIGPSGETILILASLPIWLLLFRFNGLYDRDEERADHSTSDEFFGVVQALTLGVWFVEVFAWVTGVASPPRVDQFFPPASTSMVSIAITFMLPSKTLKEALSPSEQLSHSVACAGTTVAITRIPMAARRFITSRLLQPAS